MYITVTIVFPIYYEIWEYSDNDSIKIGEIYFLVLRDK